MESIREELLRKHTEMQKDAKLKAANIILDSQLKIEKAILESNQEIRNIIDSQKDFINNTCNKMIKNIGGK